MNMFDIGKNGSRHLQEGIVASGTVHHLCGCDVCATVSFEISEEKSGGSSAVTLNVISPPVGYEEGWYDMVLLGENGVFASPISPDPVNGMSSIHVSKAGFYSVSLSPSHKNTDQAMAWSDNEEGLPDNAPCHLLLDEPFPTGISERFALYPLIEVTLTASKEEHLDEVKSDDNDPFWVVGDSCDYELYFDPAHKAFPLCRHDDHSGDKFLALSACNGDASNKTTAILLGDSHAHELTSVMKKYHPELNEWYLPRGYHGAGIYHNLSPDNKYEEYLKGEVKAEFVEGTMLHFLRNGEYEALQKKHKFNIWFFESGAWDLRDVGLSEYEDRITELFEAFVKFRELFKDTDTPLRLVWLGVPAFSFKRKHWGGMEKRTNVKEYRAHLATAKKAKESDIKMLPFFDATYPVFRQSCDTHHYICNYKAGHWTTGMPLKDYNPIGHEILKSVLHEGNVCIADDSLVVEK